MHLGEDRFHDRYKISLMSEVNQPKYPFKLLKTDNSGCSTHETHYCCMRQKVHDKPKSANIQHIYIQNIISEIKERVLLAWSFFYQILMYTLRGQEKPEKLQQRRLM